MARKTVWTIVSLLALSSVLYAMGRKAEKQDDATFDAKAVGTAPDPHISDATAEQKPVGLPEQPSDVEKDTAKGFRDPFFKDTEKDPDLEPTPPTVPVDSNNK